METIVKEKRYNLTDPRLAKVCGISESTTYKWRWNHHRIPMYYERWGSTRTIKRNKSAGNRVWIKIPNDHKNPFARKLSRQKTMLEHRFVMESYLAKHPEYRLKRELIDRIINCPDTDVLKMADKLVQLDFLFFNNPKYGIGSSNPTTTYFGSVFFKSPTFKSLATIDALLERIRTLEISDFKKVGLENQINSETLDKLKDHATEVVNDYIQEYYSNYELVGITYQTEELRDLQTDFIRALWKAGAYLNENRFAPYSEALGVFNLKPNFFNQHVSSSGMTNTYSVMILNSKLDNLINEQMATITIPSGQFTYSDILSTDVTSSLFSNDKLNALIEAKEKLILYQEKMLEAMKTWKSTDSGIKSWFEKLFVPSTGRVGYTVGWDKDPLYRGWMVTTKLLNIWGTSLISGDSIPDSAFDTGHPLRYVLHHKDGSNTMSLASYDIALGYEQYHPLPIGSMSQKDLDRIEAGIKQLYQIGLDRLTPINGEWVTLSDFKRVFPDTLLFDSSYGGNDYRVSLYEMWANIYAQNQNFDQKMGFINAKIQTYKDAVIAGENPSQAVLNKFWPSAEDRFLSSAKDFMSQFIRLVENGVITGLHIPRELECIWRVYLFKKTFNLD